MPIATLTTDFRLTIPKSVRERLGLRPGQRLSVIVKGGAIHLVPQVPVADLRGFVRGISADGLRDKTDPLRDVGRPRPR